MMLVMMLLMFFMMLFRFLVMMAVIVIIAVIEIVFVLMVDTRMRPYRAARRGCQPRKDAADHQNQKSRPRTDASMRSHKS